MKNLIRKLVFVFPLLFLFSISSLAQYGWFQQSSPTSDPLGGVFFIDENIGFAVDEWYGKILKTTNGGLNWTMQTSGFGGLYKLCFLNIDTGTIVGANGSIIFTTDGGVNWIIKSSGTTSNLNKIRFVKSNTGYTPTGFIVGVNGVVLKTTNSGYNWFSQNSTTSHYLYGVYFTDMNTGYIVGQTGYQSGQSTILKTTNEGNNWVNISPNIYKTLTGVYFINPNTGIAVGGSGYYNDGIILKTSNGGNNWQTVFTGSSAFHGISYLNNNIMTAIGNDGLVVRSTDASSTWFIQNTPTSVLLKEVSFVNENTGWIVGHNGVILKTTTGGIPLPIPVLISPPNWSHGNSLTPTLLWNNITGIINYHVQVSTVANFSLITDSATVTNNQYTIPAGRLTNAITYFWRVNATNSIGTGPWSEIWNFSTLLVNIKQTNSNIPSEFVLYQNYPNPFNPSTTIRFDINKPSYVRITIYDNLGKTVSEVVNENLTAGSYEVNWEAMNYTSGIYFYRIETKDFIDVKKMILLK